MNLLKSKSRKYKINDGFITQKIGNKVTVFAGEESILFTLNSTAAYMFQGLKLGWDEKKIIMGVTNKYNVDEHRAQEDLNNLTADLLEKKIIVKG